MIFFTRELYDKMQTGSVRVTPAEREWVRRVGIYDRYRKLIAPLLPSSVARLARDGLHDATIVSATQASGSLLLVVDTSHALSKLRSRRPRKLLFGGVRRPVNTRNLRGAWWVADEAHLSSRARFALHILFHRREAEIEAESLSIK